MPNQIAQGISCDHLRVEIVNNKHTARVKVGYEDLYHSFLEFEREEYERIMREDQIVSTEHTTISEDV